MIIAMGPARTARILARLRAVSPDGFAPPPSTRAPIDVGRVASIRAAIAGGLYTIDPKAIAAKMIALDLPSRA